MRWSCDFLVADPLAEGSQDSVSFDQQTTTRQLALGIADSKMKLSRKLFRFKPEMEVESNLLQPK